MKESILVIGGNGLLGSWLCPFLKENTSFQVLIHGRTHGDVTGDLSSLKESELIFNQIKPKFILNLAALTDVDLCEKDPTLATQANVYIPVSVANYLKKNPQTFAIQISTDHIYDGPGKKSENEITIRNVYGLSKYAGDLALSGTQSAILRTNFFGKSIGPKASFSDWIVKVFKSGDKFQLFSDVYFSPVHWQSLAQVILQLLKSPQAGVFNLGASTSMNKSEFAQSIAKSLNIYREGFEVLTSSEKPGRAARPKNMVMSVSFIEKAFNIKMPTLEEEILKLKKEYL